MWAPRWKSNAFIGIFSARTGDQGLHAVHAFGHHKRIEGKSTDAAPLVVVDHDDPAASHPSHKVSAELVLRRLWTLQVPIANMADKSQSHLSLGNCATRRVMMGAL